MGGVILLVVGLTAAPALAYDYSTSIYIHDDEDLLELYYSGLLEEDEYQVLVELLNSPVDINTATADALYDLPGISHTTAAAIVKRIEDEGPFKSRIAFIDMPGVGDDVFEQLLPFIDDLPPLEQQLPVKGIFKMRLGAPFEKIEPLEEDHPNKTHRIEQLGYGKFPPLYLSGQLSVNKWLEMGLLGTVQEEVASTHYDPATHDFKARWGTPVFELDKGYVSAKGPDGSGILGSYTAGFGRRLTFDVSDRTEPHGWYRDTSVNTSTNTFGLLDLFRPQQRLFGGSARLTALRFGRSRFDLSIFGSSRLHDLYQYHLGFEEGGELVSPRVYVHDLYGEYQKVGYMTLPNAYREDLVGGNVTFRLNELSHVGVTGYVAHIDKTVIDGVTANDDWQFRYRMPNRDYFGAFGVDFLVALGMLDLAGEYSHNDNNGNALLLQANLSRPRVDLDFVFRSYDVNYDNPHNRGIAASDVYGGLRARDETGFRFKGMVQPTDWLKLRAETDIWERPSTGVWNFKAYGKLELLPIQEIRLSGFTRWTNKDLVNNGRTRVYAGAEDIDLLAQSFGYDLGDYEVDENVIDGAGSRTQVGGQLDIKAIPATTITLYYQRFYEDANVLYPTGDGPCEPWFLVGNYFWVKARVKPGKFTTLTWRLKLADDDVYGSLGGKWFVSYLQIEQKIGRPPKPRAKIILRGSIGRYLLDLDSGWYADCKNAGVPNIVDGGTCLTGETDSVDEPPEEVLYGSIIGGFEFRF